MTMERSSAKPLGAENYILLTTFRRDGTPVGTPVWTVSDGDNLVVWTDASSAKVKRIRRDPKVTVAPCSVNGKVRGPAVSGRAEVLDGAGTERVRKLIKKKYWLSGRVLVFLSVWRKGADATVGLRVMLDGPSGAAADPN